LLQGLERQLETPKSININKKVEGQWTTKTQSQSQSQTYNKQRTCCEISQKKKGFYPTKSNYRSVRAKPKETQFETFNE
jgi:hypothetical protein